MAQLISITSEALQATVRRLLPSQQGFGEDLQATNVVTPIIDLTPTAEGSSVPAELQRAWDISTSLFTTANTTNVLANTGGFYQVDVLLSAGGAGSTAIAVLDINDGLTTTNIWKFSMPSATSAPHVAAVEQTFVVFLRAGDSLRASTNDAAIILNTWTRFIADLNGVLRSPLGFDPQ